MLYLRRVSRSKFYIYLWIIISFVFIIYTEFFTYYLNAYKWLPMSCEDESKCTRILLVADPQIIGNKNEVFHSLTPLTIFDSDRYLKKTYFHAYNFVKPQVVIFLGDLMDEAHIATDQEFNQYVKRFFDIFLDHSLLSDSTKHIWLPGDNDIGGEDTIVTPKKLQRFERAFSQPNFIPFKNITFFKINRLTSIIPVYKKKREFYDTSNIFVGLSHLPMMFPPSSFVRKVFAEMLPQLIFSAHEHKAMIMNTDVLLRQDYYTIHVTPGNNQVFQYSLGVSDMYEIMIPTCSYRMGTSRIGYGYAIIENNNLKITFLWSPTRLQQVIFLLCFMAVSVLILCCTCCARRLASRKIYVK